MSYAHAYPLAQGGGLFVLIVGLGIVLGAIFTRLRYMLLGVSGGIAALAIWILGPVLAKPFGEPSPLQFWSLALAIVFEIVAVPIIARRFRPQGERARNLAVLFVVGIHFILMGPAFGPVIVVLGVLAMLNAAIGLRTVALNLQYHWLLDGIVKIVAGALLWFVVPVFGR